MPGPTRHPSINCAPHKYCLSGLLCEVNLVPGGDNCVLLKLKSPNRYACADIYGLTREYSNKLSVELA